MTLQLELDCRVDCFFFFKQKTAYEVRISDLSSDVCSSDLPGSRTAEHAGSADGLCTGHPRSWPERPVARRHRLCRPDRKSVVEGKSVSVRVDLGGRRTHQKNTKTPTNSTTTHTT